MFRKGWKICRTPPGRRQRVEGVCTDRRSIDRRSIDRGTAKRPQGVVPPLPSLWQLRSKHSCRGSRSERWGKGSEERHEYEARATVRSSCQQLIIFDEPGGVRSHLQGEDVRPPSGAVRLSDRNVRPTRILLWTDDAPLRRRCELVFDNLVERASRERKARDEIRANLTR